MSLQKSLEKLQKIVKDPVNYSISVSPTLKSGQLQYQLKNNGYIKYIGLESEVIAFIAGILYIETER